MKPKHVVPGRPTKYTDELASEICMRLRMGETLVKICRDKHMPARQKIYEWQSYYPAFRVAYARAREEQMLAWADEIIDIADNATADYTIKMDAGQGAVAQFNAVHVKRANAQIRVRQWLMERIAPAIFSKNQSATPSSLFSEMSDEELIETLRRSLQSCGFTQDQLLDLIGAKIH